MSNLIKPSKGGENKGAVAILDFVILASISLIFFLCPLFFTGLVVQGLGFEKMILFYFFTLFGVVAWVTKGVIVGELKLKRTPLDLPVLFFLLFLFVSTILSVNQKDSLIGLYGSSAKSFVAAIVFILFYYLLVNNINLRRLKIIFWSLISSCSLIVVYSLLQLRGIYVLPFNFSKAITFNPLGSLSGLTMFLVIALPLLVVALTQFKKIQPNINDYFALGIRIFLGIIILGIAIILVILSGFAFWPAAIVSLVIVLMFFLSKIVKTSSQNLIIPIAVFMLLIIFLVLGNFNFVRLDLPAEVSLSRKISWDIAKQGMKENPILGSGPSTFYYNFSKFKGVDFNSSPLWNVRFESASGVLFESLVTIGIVGTLILIVLTLIAVSICFLSLIKTSEKEASSMLLALFASFVAVIIFLALFTVSNSLILISVLIACLATSSAIIIYPEKFRTTSLSFRSSPQYALALAAIFLCVSAGVVIFFTLGLKMYLADYYAKKSVESADVNVKIENLNKAIQLVDYRDNYYLSIANHFMGLANSEARTTKDQLKIQNYLASAIDYGKKGVAISPNKASINESLALIYENASFYVRGALEWSENHYNKVIELDPDNPTPYFRIALINIARSNLEEDKDEKEYYINEAIKKYEEAISKKSDLSAAYYGEAVAYEMLGDLNNTIEQLKKAVILSQGNANYRFELGRVYFNRGVTQPNISQTASKEIATQEVVADGDEGEEVDEEQISVEPSQPVAAQGARNDDLNIAEQVFLGILATNPNHANSLYSLALLYQKVGERDNTEIVVKRLLEILPEDATKEAVKQQFTGYY